MISIKSSILINVKRIRKFSSHTRYWQSVLFTKLLKIETVLKSMLVTFNWDFLINNIARQNAPDIFFYFTKVITVCHAKMIDKITHYIKLITKVSLDCSFISESTWFWPAFRKFYIYNFPNHGWRCKRYQLWTYICYKW